MSALELFHFPDTGQPVRTVIVDDEPWFIAADVCTVLSIRNNRDALASLDDDERGVATTDTLGGPQQVATVNEPGLYSLILRSRKPEAKAFKRWVTHEVLPSIRKTGAYAVQQPALPRDLPTALRALADEMEAHHETRAELEQEKPLAEAYRDLMDADGTFDWAATAQIFARITGGLGRNTFLELLRSDALKVLKSNNTPYQFAGLERCFKVTPAKGGKHAVPTTRVTPEGLDWLRKRLIKHFNHQAGLFAIGEIA